ncbi:MAG: IS982 family transposase [Janthinobacterium lividum]
MREQTVAMYCFLDDLLTLTRPVRPLLADPRRRLSDAQVLTTALVAARFFGGNLTRGRHYMEQHWGQNRLDKNGFTRRLHRLSDTLLALFATCGHFLKELHTEARYVIDSFPVAVCQNIRIPRCKLLTGKAYRGRSASKRQWFYGFKVQVIITSDGLPVEFYVHAGSEADITGLRAMAVDLPDGSLRYTDNAYPDYVLEDLLAEATGGQQFTARKATSKRPHSPAQQFLLQHFRKGVETTFSQLTARFPKHIHAVTAAGFVLKLALFIFVHTLDQVGH